MNYNKIINLKNRKNKINILKNYSNELLKIKKIIKLKKILNKNKFKK